MTIVTSHGRRMCNDCHDQLLEVERLLGKRLVVFQGGYNAGGVAASAGTHDRGMCIDVQVLSYGDRAIARRTGGTWWGRTRAQGFSPHTHNNCIGCTHGTSGANYQVSEYVNHGHNGLAGRGRDDGPPVRKVTWSAYKAARDKAAKAASTKAVKAQAAARAKSLKATPITVQGKKYNGISAVTVSAVVQARKGKYQSRFVFLVQKALQQQGYYTRSPLDGRWGQLTQHAYDTWRRRNGWPDIVTGAPGLTSLRKLFALAKSPYPVRTK